MRGLANALWAKQQDSTGEIQDLLDLAEATRTAAMSRRLLMSPGAAEFGGRTVAAGPLAHGGRTIPQRFSDIRLRFVRTCLPLPSG